MHALTDASSRADRYTWRSASACARIGRLAISCLYDELALYPKPGLVSPVDSGSHDDMDAGTFFRSLFSLRHYFIRMAEAGMVGEPFDVLRRLGIAAEERMLAATNGVNTHRGAIFTLGLLCAAAGRSHAANGSIVATDLRRHLLAGWGPDIPAHRPGQASHGAEVARRHTVRGARDEAALGMPTVFDVALPVLDRTMARTRCWESACIDALFSLMAAMSDTNVYYRGGAEGAQFVRDSADGFLGLGGTAAPGWRSRAIACHRQFVERKLSPGGAADLLAAACFVYKVERLYASPSPSARTNPA